MCSLDTILHLTLNLVKYSDSDLFNNTLPRVEEHRAAVNRKLPLLERKITLRVEISFIRLSDALTRHIHIFI